MKRSRLLLVALAFAAAWALTKVFYVHPDLWPGPLKNVGNALIDAMLIESAQAASDLEFFYVFSVSWVALTLVFWVAQLLWTRWRARS